MSLQELIGLHIQREWDDDADAESTVRIYLEDATWGANEPMAVFVHRVSTGEDNPPANVFLRAEGVFHGTLDPSVDEYFAVLDPPPSFTARKFVEDHSISRCKRIGSIPLAALRSEGGPFGILRAKFTLDEGDESRVGRLLRSVEDGEGPELAMHDNLQFWMDNSDESIGFILKENLWDDTDNVIWFAQNAVFEDALRYIKEGVPVRCWVFQESDDSYFVPPVAWRIREGVNTTTGQTHYEDYIWTTTDEGEFDLNFVPVGVDSMQSVQHATSDGVSPPASYFKTLQYSVDGTTWLNEFVDSVLPPP